MSQLETIAKNIARKVSRDHWAPSYAYDYIKSVVIREVRDYIEAERAKAMSEPDIYRAAIAVRDDLMLRAEIEEEGGKLVAVGSGVWMQLCAALDGKQLSPEQPDKERQDV